MGKKEIVLQAKNEIFNEIWKRIYSYLRTNPKDVEKICLNLGKIMGEIKKNLDEEKND